MPRPSTTFSWAATPGPGYVLPVPSAVRAAGFRPDGVVRLDYANAVFQEIAGWLGYVADVLPSDDVLRVGRIVGVGDPSGTGAGLYITTPTGSGTNVVIAPSTDGSAGRVVGGAGEINDIAWGSGPIRWAHGGAGGVLRWAVAGGAYPATVVLDRDTGDYSIDVADLSVSATGTATYAAAAHRTTAGVHTFDEGVRVAPPSGGFAYAYGDGAGGSGEIAVEIGASPFEGGYTFVWSTVAIPGNVGFYDDGGWIKIRNVSGGAITVRAIRPLPQLVGNVSAGASPYKAVWLWVDWESSSGSTSVRLVSRLRGGGGSTWTTELTSTPSSPTDDNGGTPLTLTTEERDYAIMIEHASLADDSNTVGIRDIVLTITKSAIE